MQNAKHDSIPIIAVIGPTASGKSDAAVAIAHSIQKHASALGVSGAEIISADSRQVYKGFDLTSGKVTQREMRGIPHYLLDVASPRRTFTVARYQKLGRAAIKKIMARNKIPIVCGGTGLFVDALLLDARFPAVKPNAILRKQLEKLTTEKLFARLAKKDPRRAAGIDKHNRRRLIRALEIIHATRKPVPPVAPRPFYKNTIIIGINPPAATLAERIEKRVHARIRRGMIAEVSGLHARGLSWQRLEQFGLEYRWISRYLQGKITKDDMAASLTQDIKHYAKRQMTWFKRNKDVLWTPNANRVPAIAMDAIHACRRNNTIKPNLPW